MQDEITVSPLVDILSKQLGEQVVMNGDDYVYYAGLLKVEQPKVEVALLEQQRLYDEEVLKNAQNDFNNATQSHLDTKAKEFRYDNMMSARSYAGYTNQFQVEAQKLAVWASDCWVKAGEIEAEVQAGNRDMPTIDEVLAELPIYE